MSNLDAILAAAKEQAANLPAVAPAAVPSIGPNGANALAPAGGGYNMSMDAFLNPGGMECESYVQVKEGGIKLHKDWTGFVDQFDAILNLSEVQFFIGIRKEVGSTVSYAKSYDGQTTARGENFATVVEEFKRTSQKPADTYRGADIPLTLIAGAADPKGKGPELEADAIVGLTTSITGFKPFASFAKKLAAAGYGNTPVKVRVTHEVRQNAQKQNYGVCTFDLVEVPAVADAA